MCKDIRLLEEARQEIISLRRHNELLSAKVEVMDLFACVLHTSPAVRHQAASVDIAWELQKRINELKSSQ